MTGARVPAARPGGQPAGWRRARRWAGRLFIGLAGLMLAAAAAGALYQWSAERRDLRTYSPPGQMVDVGGYRLHLHCTGTAGPTVVFDAGLGGNFLTWAAVQRAVASFARACSYDRAGLGWSESGPRPRTAGRIVEELNALLRRAAVPGPYILVGHSLGGLHVRLYAFEHPGDVAGLVLVDPSHEEQLVRVSGRVLALLARGGRDVAQLMVRNVDEAVVRELKRRAARRNHSAEQEHREILEQALLRPRRRSLAEVLAAMPNAGDDADFERRQIDRRG